MSEENNKKERFGLYEVGESQKKCSKCGSTNSRIKALWEIQNLRRRKRECVDCGKIFISDIPITPKANPLISGLKIV